MHGSPRIEFCEKCILIGLIPRFSKSKCPTCGGDTRQVTKSEARYMLVTPADEEVPLGFTWKKINKST